MRNRRFICLILALGIIPSVAQATDLTKNSSIKIGGEVDSQFGIVNQQDAFRKNLETGQYYNKNSLANSGALKFNYDNKSETGLGYGAYIKLNASTSESPSGSKNIGNEVKIYVQDTFGKIELGNTSPVGSSMQVNPYTFARATGGLDGDWDNWLKNGGVIDSTGKKKISGTYLTSPKLPVGFDETNKAGKINYFSPIINGFSFGVSYTPDSKAKGTAAQAKDVLKNTDGGYKNIWQPTVRYETSFENGVKFSTAVLGEFGKAKKVSYYDDITKINEDPDLDKSNIDRKNLKAWQVGAGVDYKGFAFAGAYGDIGKTGDLDAKKNPTDVKAGGKYWSLGSAYSTEKYGISVNYMQSKRAGCLAKVNNSKDEEKFVKYGENEYNKFEAVSIGADYVVMPGFMPYIEVTKFKFKENANYDKNANKATFNKGTVILAGTKIKF
ncbi:MAG: porin [Rickettsiales bacterium]|jgi:predicted porin|nr:porin [Rickettsiales bacterium]